jgi:SAM-dependent methyltransferase
VSAPAIDAEAFYQEFSLAVGARDWRAPNPRHELLRLLVAERLGGRGRLRLLDVGCGAGVMSAHLRRYGAVTALDFSAPAVALGRALAPGVRFLVGSAAALPPGERFDVVTLFDVLEHIPPAERVAVFEQIAERLAEGGELILSTPHPRFSDWLVREAPALAQAVEERVELTDVLTLAAPHGVVLDAYETYDVDRAGPQYQFIALRRAVTPGARIAAPRTRHARPLRRRVRRGSGIARRVRLAAAAARAGRWGAAAWLLRGRGAPPG